MFTRILRFSKLVISFIVCLTVAIPAFAGDVYVKGYTRKDGSYVRPHYRTAPDSKRNNNWSTQGNVNPYTGKSGTVQRDNDRTKKDIWRNPSEEGPDESNKYDTFDPFD
jgi:hypothetical protein